MKAVVDRIEDGDIAVIQIENAGEIKLPADCLGTDIYEGAHLDITVRIDKESEKAACEDIKSLQKELLERNDSKDDNN
ncbi:MAG: DUF3006 domain-containing protein [Elusimicrobiota bacterium]